ncbi:Flp pilus assembly protein CpaB [Sphingomonas sp. LHG3406-1]|uniref:Flp pilus assembly protein CpaB n=1 Tax=Sphingomonas sp. LHG3406-1 TaxID=2804617 RepID=UPI002617FC86|nr:Flp pilus assembly protein CpaB [Sphingomonas sp. LHG3406-1]
MDVKKIALLVGALLVAAVTAVMAKNMFTGASAPEAQAAAVPAGPKILVARKPLPVGAMVDAESFAFQPWPAELMQQTYFSEGGPDADMQKMIGMVVRNPITAGQPLTRGSLVGPQDRGFLAAALSPGMRAVTVPVNDISGVAGFIFPGDRVDMVLTQTVTGGGDGPPLKVSETIIRNLRVLATDQAIDRNGEDGKPVVKSFGKVTFEVTPKLAEKIAVAQSLGTISLTLRSLADSQAELERLVASGQVKVPAGANPAEERKMLLAIANQPIDNAPTFATGGDVSRFQRRTVPARGQDKAGEALAAVGRMTGEMVRAAQGGAPAGQAGGAPSGPVVRVARGNNVSFVPVGAR